MVVGSTQAGWQPWQRPRRCGSTHGPRRCAPEVETNQLYAYTVIAQASTTLTKAAWPHASAQRGPCHVSELGLR